jgi:hypothetical protein
MAHVLIGAADAPLVALLREICSRAGHEVTIPRDAWEALGVLRTAPRPMVVVYALDGAVAAMTTEQVRALAAAADELRRHVAVEIAYGRDGWQIAALQRLYDAVHPTVVPAPCDAATLTAAIAAAVERADAIR